MDWGHLFDGSCKKAPRESIGCRRSAQKAIVEFEKVQSCGLGGGFIEQEKMLACLGRSESLISLSRFDEAISLVGTMLSAEYPDEVPSADVRGYLGKRIVFSGNRF